MQPSNVCPHERFEHINTLLFQEVLGSCRYSHAKLTEFPHFVVIVISLDDRRPSGLAHARSRVRMIQEPANRSSKLSGIGRPVEKPTTHAPEKRPDGRQVACHYR